MWAEKDPMKVGDVIRNSLSGEIAIVVEQFKRKLRAKSILNKPIGFYEYIEIEVEQNYWDVLE